MKAEEGKTLKSNKQKEKGGRPPLDPNWDEIDEALEAGMSGAEIAESYGMSSDWLYLRCKQEKGVGFSEYSRQKKLNGNRQLHVAQFKKAINGDNTMLIWLGKNRLDQVDRREVVQISELDQHARGIVASIKRAVKKAEELPVADLVAIAASKYALDPEQLLDRAKRYAQDDPVVLDRLTSLEIGGVQ